MFHSKHDVDRHVCDVFKNMKSEYQRNLKCYQIAKLYYKFKDYKSAIKYINRYILSTTNSAAAHRLLGECYLGMNLKVKAFNSFKTSLELNGSQHDLVLKVCTLLLDPEIFAVTPRSTYWLERAESLFPTNPVVFQLREQILKSNLDGKQYNVQLEKLILSEIKARPTDVNVRIRLLNFFVETKRYKLAYQHALEIEDRGTFLNDLRWYDCLYNVIQAYEKANNNLNFIFYVKKLLVLERRADLFMQEFQDEIKTLPDCSSAIFALDQNLHSISTIEVPREHNYFYQELMKHMNAQLAFHLATLVLKRTKKEYGVWPKAFRTANPLLLKATQNTMDLEGAWYSMWIGKNQLEIEVKNWNKSAALRISQAGRILLSSSQNKGSKIVEKISQICVGKWQIHTYQDIFYNKEHQLATATSHFVNDRDFSDVPMRLLTETELNQFHEVAQSAYPDSLHHLVWLGLAYCNSNGQLNHDFRCTVVPDLRFTIDNLSQTGPETLNQLDVDAFLYASVLCGKSSNSTMVNSERPSRLPISISEELCTPAQVDWWTALYKTYKNESVENIAVLRLTLKRGIETIRAFGQHGLHVKLIVMLAKIFQERATKSKDSTEANGLEERAYLYWSAAIPMLEKVEKNLQLRVVPNRLFDYRGNELTQNETKMYLEDGRLFLACRLMKQGQHEQAIEAFQLLKSAYASFYQGLIYQKLASEDVNSCPEAITSENRSQHIIFLTRARDAFYLTLDRLRSPSVDPNHPLNLQLHNHLEEIEKQFSVIDSDGSFNKNGDTESDETDTVPHPMSPDIDDNLNSSFNVFNTSNILSLKNHGTPHNLRQNYSEKHATRFEARPSPERLDAQMRYLMQSNNNGLQCVTDQLKELKSIMQIELKDLGCVTRDLLAEMKKWNDKVEFLIQRKMDTIKPEDIFNLEEFDDLTNQLPQSYPPFQNYMINRQAMGSQATSSVNYGAAIPSPVPSVIPSADNSLMQPSFYPGPQGVPPVDSSLLYYQTLGYYPGLPYGDNQNIPDYRGLTIPKDVKSKNKGIQPSKNGLKPPETSVPAQTCTNESQPPNVVITSSDTLPTFTTVGTPTMSVTIPLQHIRGLAPVTTTKGINANQIHPFQIQMPAEAQLVKESPTEKLNLIAPSTTQVLNSPTQTVNMSSETLTPPSSRFQTKETKEITPTPEKVTQSAVTIETQVFESQAQLFVCENKNWIDKGCLHVKILRGELLNKSRILGVCNFKVILDELITPNFVLESVTNSETSWVWHTKAAADANEAGLKRFVQFNSADDARNFERAFNECWKHLCTDTGRNLIKSPFAKSTIKSCGECKKPFEGNHNKCAPCQQKEKPNEKPNVGGFTFVSSPIIKPPVLKMTEEKEKPKETIKPGPFAAFSFSSTTSTIATTTIATSPATTITTTVTATPISYSDFKTPESSTNKNVTPKDNSFNLFAAVKPDPNSFKKDANFKGFEGQNSQVFGYLNKQKSANSQSSFSVKFGANKDEKEGGEEGEYESTAEFAPIVDLPELVDVKTGEENDVVLFNERTKLLRFVTDLKEWKERGVGNMKILLNEESGKVRLIMRRELVLKVCCNHYLDENMEFKPLTKSQNALTWYAQDYSEGDLKAELFALRFKSPELMNKFHETIKNTQSKMQNGRMPGKGGKESKDEKPKEQKPLSELFKPSAGSWECGTCLIRNESNTLKCISCESPKPGSGNDAKGVTSAPKLLGKGITLPKTTFEFGTPQSSAELSGPSVVTASNQKFTFGISQGTPVTSSSSGSIFANPQSTTTNTSLTSFTFGSQGSLKSGLGTGNAASSTTSSLSSSTFSFSFSKAGFDGVKNIFGGSPLKKDEKQSELSVGNPFSFKANVKPQESDKLTFPWNNENKASKTTEIQKTSPAKEKGSGENADSESNEEYEEDSGDHIVVNPVVPLPEKVELYTGEEDEYEIYRQRAKLFRFSNKEWKERGVGDVKILKHKINSKIRLLMRRDIVLKVCLNHYVTPDIEFKTKDDKTWQWSAPDFSEGEVSYDMLAIRFKNPEFAQNFMKALQDARNNVIPAGKIGAESQDLIKTVENFSFMRAEKNVKGVESTKNVGLVKSEEDVTILFENQVTPEQKQKAEALHLPVKFYSYLDAPECPGCVGCEANDDKFTFTDQTGLKEKVDESTDDSNEENDEDCDDGEEDVGSEFEGVEEEEDGNEIEVEDEGEDEEEEGGEEDQDDDDEEHDEDSDSNSDNGDDDEN